MTWTGYLGRVKLRLACKRNEKGGKDSLKAVWNHWWQERSDQEIIHSFS